MVEAAAGVNTPWLPKGPTRSHVEIWQTHPADSLAPLISPIVPMTVLFQADYFLLVRFPLDDSQSGQACKTKA